MEDKITLGKFIQSKRKELGLSQKDLAKELYVTESAVSKWERGVSYPDITMISGLCRVLGISEHELCTASEDNQQREAEFMARSYKSFVRGYTIITGIGYLAAIIPSFIYNVAHGGIGWFMVLITSLMLTFSIINVPVLVKKNRALWTLGFCDGLAYASLRRRVRLFTRGLVCNGDTWNTSWGGYHIFAFRAEK